MEVVLYVIYLVFIGGVIGGLARLALPGRDPMSLGQTVLVGMVGSLVAGLVSWALFGQGAGFLLSFVFAFAIVYAVRRSRGGSLTRPGTRRRGAER